MEDFWIPDVGDDAYLVLFEPFQKGLIAQVQYRPVDPEEKPGFIVYKIRQSSPGYDWSKSYENEQSHLSPVINLGKRLLVTTTKKEVLVFNTDSRDQEPEPLARFSLPLGDGTIWVSCGADGSLYWSGVEKGIAVLAATDSNGDKKWRWQAGLRLGPERSKPVAPPIVTPDRVFLLTKKNLFVVKDGRLLWSFEAKEANFTSGTALADGSILIAEGNTLHRLNAQGNSLFQASINEVIVTPPVIDGEGNIYVASPETLYAFH